VPIGVVSTGLFGASAADIENLITNKLEEGIKNNVNNIKKITSTSRSGGSSIVVEFDASANLDKSIQDLKDEVDKLKGELPEDATDPSVFEIDFANDPIISFSLISDLPEKTFSQVANDLEERVKTIPGVSDVIVGGLRDREVQVIASREKLSQFGLNITDVIGAIGATNTTLPAGSITISDIRYNVQFEGDIEDPNEIADIAILSQNGTPIYVRDVATVVDGFERRTSIARTSLEGAPSQNSLTFSVTKKAGTNVTDVTEAVISLLDELKQEGELLSGMETLVTFDSGEQLLKDLVDLSRTGLQTVILVMLVLYLAVGWREALVAGSAIPLSFLIAFILLLLTGNTINFVSLFALILAIGILVDSGIVIVEGINVRLHTYKNKVEAAKATIREFHAPLTSGTMTTIAVFAPLFFISGITGEFIKSIPFTVISVLLASLLVALGFVPLLGSRFLHERMGQSRLGSRQAKYTERLTEWYRKKLCYILETRLHENVLIATIAGLIFFALALPIKGILAGMIQGGLIGLLTYYTFKVKRHWFKRFLMFVPATLMIFVISSLFIPKFGAVKVEFFGGGDQEFVIVELELPEGSILTSSDIEARKVEEILYEVPEIESFSVTVGSGSAFTETGRNEKHANAFILLKEDRDRTSSEISNELRQSFSEITSSTIRVTEISDGPPVGTPVVITFFGEDLGELERIAEDAGEILRGIPGATDIVTSTKDDGTEFVLEIDKAKATELGLNSSFVSQIIRASVSGIEATTINSLNDDIEVIVKLDLNQEFKTPHDTNRTTIDAIRQIEVQTQRGPILLGSVLSSDVAKGKTTISHEDGKRRATVGAELTATGNTREIVAVFKEQSKEQNLVPPTIEMVVGGENEETDQSFAEMGIAFVVGVVLMFAILVLQFNSLRFAVYVISVIPTAFVGIFTGLLITGQALSFPSLMGLIALSGIVVNNAIILIDTINHRREKEPERGVTPVVVEGSISRVRPILLTTITTIIGIAPLTLASALWAPLAWSVMFGLTFTSVATLFLIPILYVRKPGTLDA
jgi:HAE1 family hydrophobic/amphiphilic exporter-1